MSRLLRVITLGGFASAGIALAVCLATSGVPQPDQPTTSQQPQLAVRVLTEPPLVQDNQQPGSAGAQATRPGGVMAEQLHPERSGAQRMSSGSVAQHPTGTQSTTGDQHATAAQNDRSDGQSGVLKSRSDSAFSTGLPVPPDASFLSGRLLPQPVEPFPPVAQQAQPPAAESERLQEAYELLRRHLGGNGGSASAQADSASDSRAAESAPLPPPLGGAGQPSATVQSLGKPNRQTPRAVIDSEGNGKFSLRIQNADIREVLDMLSEQGNMNILASNSVQGKVSCTLTDVDIESALQAILRSTGYVARRDGKFVFVGTAEDVASMEHSLDRISTRVYRPNYVTAAELQKLIQPLLTERVGIVTVSTPAQIGIQTSSDQAGGNSYSGSDVVVVRDYEAVLVQIDQMLREVDVRPPQVHIEAMILSVKLADKDKFGVNFELLRDKANVRLAVGKPETPLAAMTLEKGALKFGFLDGSLAAFLEALETIGDTNVIATPRLMVLNKQRAEIQIGEKKGYVSTTVTETSSTQSVEFLDVGALLRIRPFISSDGLIRMEVHPELSDGAVEIAGGFTLPNKEVTQVTTNIMVRDGCTVIIGGLMRENLISSVNQLPLLGNLPLVGWLFRHTTETVERREVLVLITPHIVYEPDTCREGEQAACEFHRRQALYADKMSIFGKRSIGRRYFRLAQSAYAAGDRDTALRFAEMAVHFDPLNRAAIDLRSDIWLGKPYGSHTLQQPEPPSVPPSGPDAPPTSPLDQPNLPDWLLDQLQRQPGKPTGKLHPLDPGQPGAIRSLPNTGRMN
jgi:type IV pilus assembly protein PilQ